jgi:hypothetical protein
MMLCMKWRRAAICVAMACLAMPLAPARADDSEESYDARTQGYDTGIKTQMDDSGTVGAWFVFVPLSLLALGVMFKNANRSHLD